MYTKQTPQATPQLLISTIRPTAHTNLSRKRSFTKTLFKPEEFETASFAFYCGRQHFENRAFRK